MKHGHTLVRTTAAVTNITVTPASLDVEGGTSVTLTCLAEGNPLPSITWQRNGQFVTAGAVQAATGFRQTARSTLTLVTSTTRQTEMIICTANTNTEGPTVTDTATAVVNIASRLIHQRPALVTLYSLPPSLPLFVPPFLLQLRQFSHRYLKML